MNTLLLTLIVALIAGFIVGAVSMQHPPAGCTVIQGGTMQ